MRWLELRIPPPLVALLIAAAMWGIARVTPLIAMSQALRITIAVGLAAVGAAFSAAGMITFHRARTTVNPMKPETASALVTTGIYGVTRNPMYVGLAIVLTAWAVYLSCVWSLPGPLAFVLYITRLQILPEERVLSGMFGSAFEDYRARVRRWL